MTELTLTASELKKGDRIQSFTGKTVTVKEIAEREGRLRVVVLPQSGESQVRFYDKAHGLVVHR
jgi:preprotein translocase subunit YajC